MKVTLPKSQAAYYVIVCGDGGKVVVELDETNNCRASSTTVTVTP